MGEVLRVRRSRMIATDEHIPSHLDQGAPVAGLFRRRARRGREDDYGGEDEQGRQAGRRAGGTAGTASTAVLWVCVIQFGFATGSGCGWSSIASASERQA